jgi:4a-hydroxytetrahydrobiopterin dehydratase
MSALSPAELTQKKCRPCEGGVDPLSLQEAEEQVKKLPGWSLASDGKAIRRQWVAKDFDAAIRFFNDIAHVANAENHHPDLHLTGYRKVAVELSTHAIGGLSENDFILAAKIDQIPLEQKRAG